VITTKAKEAGSIPDNVMLIYGDEEKIGIQPDIGPNRGRRRFKSSHPPPRKDIMTIGIIGSRRRTTIEDYDKILAAFLKVYKKGDTIVSGHCPEGGDLFAEHIAYGLNVPILLFPAEWKKYGKAAGFKRNGLIAEAADTLIACVASDRTGGTEDTIKKYKKLGKTDLISV